MMDKEWPKNWREISDRMSESIGCHRCGEYFLYPRLYHLSERFPNTLVCELCANAYDEHCKKFDDDIKERMEKRKNDSQQQQN